MSLPRASVRSWLVQVGGPRSVVEAQPCGQLAQGSTGSGRSRTRAGGSPLQGECIADRDAAMASREPLRLPARERLRPDRPKLQRTERRQDVLVQKLPVVHPRLRRELGCVRLRPGADHVLGERESAHFHLGQRPELLPPTEFSTERDRIPLPVERLGIDAALPAASEPATGPLRSSGPGARSPCHYSLAPLRCLQGCHHLPMLIRARVHRPKSPAAPLHSKPPPRLPAPNPLNYYVGGGVACRWRACRKPRCGGALRG